jgi:hypothetical protein
MIFFENVKGFTQQFDKNKVKGRIYSKYVTEALERSVKDCVDIVFLASSKLCRIWNSAEKNTFYSSWCSERLC